MKPTKLSLLAAIALGGLMTCGPIARAQDNNTTTPPANNGNSSEATPHRRGGHGMQGILAQLNLTDDQKEQIKPVMKDQGQQMKALHQDSSLSGADRREKMKSITEATDTKLKGILTPDQYTKYQDLRKQMMSQRRAHGAKGNANNNNGTSTAPLPTN